VVVRENQFTNHRRTLKIRLTLIIISDITEIRFMNKIITTSYEDQFHLMNESNINYIFQIINEPIDNVLQELINTRILFCLFSKTKTLLLVSAFLSQLCTTRHANFLIL
jgi:hypothetical protein